MRIRYSKREENKIDSPFSYTNGVKRTGSVPFYKNDYGKNSRFNVETNFEWNDCDNFDDYIFSESYTFNNNISI